MFSVALAGMTFAQQQIQVLDEQPTPVQNELSAQEPKDLLTRGAYSAKGDEVEVEVYYSEGFSNGLAGEGDNGAWTTAGPEGDLWFQTFPPLDENGYSSTGVVPEYGDILPNFNGGLDDDVIPFTTAADGFMMFDADRANSTCTDPELCGIDFLTSNLLDAQIISPAIDLTGVENALLSFWERWRICCFAYDDALTLDFSIDGGTSWIPFSLHALTPDLVVSGAGGPFLEGEPAIDISPFLQQADDLSDCRIRVRWNPAEEINSEGNAIPASHYYAMIDDINIIGLPANDLVAGATFFNDYWINLADEGANYVSRFENFRQPDYSTRAFNFGTIVSNEGSEEQTGVRLTVSAFLDGVAIEEDGQWSTPVGEEITLAPGETDTLLISDIAPSWWIDEATNPAPGVYSFEFFVEQDQEEQRPSDNFGLDRATRITTDEGNDGFAIMQNDRNQYTNFYGTLGDDVIWGNRFTFDEIDVENNLLITHVEFALAGTAQASTSPGEEIFVNVGTGDAFSGEANDVDAVTRFFEEDEVPYVILEEDLTTGGTLNWISVELPTPVLAEPGTIYQAEINVPAIGFDAVIPCQTSGQELAASALWDWEDGAWFTLGSADSPDYEGLATALRLRTEDGIFQSTDDVLTYESGIKLMQNYPNPVVDNTMIQFQLDESSPATFEVFDISGRLVYQEDLGNVSRLQTQIITFDASEFAAGTYTYSITTETERVSRKLSIQ